MRRRQVRRHSGSFLTGKVLEKPAEKPHFFFSPESYRRYLHTPRFLAISKKMFPHGRKGRCTVCRKNNLFLYPHHRGYECIGKEKIGIDLIKVCAQCNYELTFQGNGVKTAPTRSAYLAREKFLKSRNSSMRYKVGQIRLGDAVNKTASLTGKVIKALW